MRATHGTGLAARTGIWAVVATALVGNGVTHADIVFVDIDATGNDDGTTWEHAFVCLQDALEDAQSGDTVGIAEGSYKPSQCEQSATTDQTFLITTGVEVYGGFEGGESARAERDPITHEAVLTGELTGSVNSYHVVTVGGYVSDTVLSGVEIRDGEADGTNEDAIGGGVLVQVDAGFVMSRCRIIENFAAMAGGGLGIDGFNYNTAPAIYNCDFVANECDTFGGGLANGKPLVVNSRFVGNAAWQGGGLYSFRYSANDGPSVVNSTFSHNHATGTSSNPGGGAYFFVFGGAESSVTNSVLWGNTDDNSGSDTEDEQLSGADLVTYNCIEGLEEDGQYDSGDNVNNIGDDPEFIDDDGDDDTPGNEDDNLRLAFSSPAIDVAESDNIPIDLGDVDDDGNTSEVTPLDLDQSVRVVGDEVDMGSYEYPCDVQAQADFDDDGDVDFADLLALLTAWGPCECEEDLNGDDEVDFDDLLILLSDWCTPDGSTIQDALDCMGIDSTCWDDMKDDLDTGSSQAQSDTICWIEHYNDCHCPDVCVSGPGGCGDDPCGNH